jgi:hypothetical protein
MSSSSLLRKSHIALVMWGVPSVVTVSGRRMSPKADCRIVRRCGLG